MREGLEGETYAGRYVVADARLASPVAAGEGTVVVSPKGFVLFGPLPGDRWIISSTSTRPMPGSPTHRQATRWLLS
jgi:hypothetical protein